MICCSADAKAGAFFLICAISLWTRQGISESHIHTLQLRADCVVAFHHGFWALTCISYGDDGFFEPMVSGSFHKARKDDMEIPSHCHYMVHMGRKK